MFRVVGHGAPHDADWRFGDAPAATNQLDGCKIVVWSAGFIGVLVATNGMWVDERGLPRYGAGQPHGWWSPYLADC